MPASTALRKASDTASVHGYAPPLIEIVDDVDHAVGDRLVDRGHRRHVRAQPLPVAMLV